MTIKVLFSNLVIALYSATNTIIVLVLSIALLTMMSTLAIAGNRGGGKSFEDGLFWASDLNRNELLDRDEAKSVYNLADEKRAELRKSENQSIKKDKSHRSVLPDKRKIRYYAAAGVSHVKSEDLRESINAGKEMCVEGPGDDFDCDFNSDSHDFGHRIILGFEVPLENGSIVDVSVFFQDGITIRGDDRFSAATMGGPFVIDAIRKQEIKTYGLDFNFLYKLTRNFFLGGGLGYHFFDIVYESHVVTQLVGEDVILSSVDSRDSEHESVVAATAKLRYNLGKRIFLGGDISRTLEEVGFNDDDHVTSVNAHVGVRF